MRFFEEMELTIVCLKNEPVQVILNIVTNVMDARLVIELPREIRTDGKEE